jgi:hypothetical protein
LVLARSQPERLMFVTPTTVTPSCEWRKPWSNRPRVRFPNSRACPVPVVGADPVGPFEVGKHQDMEQFGAVSRPEGV